MVRKSILRQAEGCAGAAAAASMTSRVQRRGPSSRQQLAALGYGAPKKRGRPRLNANGGGNGRKGRKGKVKAKYRDPKTNETWSGRGRMASWLKSQAGRRREDREVSRLTVPICVKIVARAACAGPFFLCGKGMVGRRNDVNAQVVGEPRPSQRKASVVLPNRELPRLAFRAQAPVT